MYYVDFFRYINWFRINFNFENFYCSSNDLLYFPLQSRCKEIRRVGSVSKPKFAIRIFYLSLRWNSLLMRFWQTLSLCSWGYDSFSRTWVYCKGHHFIHSSGLLITSWKNFVDSVNYVNAIPMSWLLEFFYEVIPLLKDCSISLLYMKFPWIDRLMSKFWCIF